MSRTKRWTLGGLLVLVSLAGGLWAWNIFTVGRWVEAAQADDPRNASFQIDGRYRHYVWPGTLVLDLTEIDPGETSPAGLWRGLFQIAARASERDRRFDRVVLARDRTPVFLIRGEDFHELGAERSLGQNPVYQIRTLPEKLYRPDGGRAFGRWTGGMLGVLREQMEDVNEAARHWIRGEPPGRS